MSHLWLVIHDRVLTRAELVCDVHAACPKNLFETMSQTLLNAVDRDAYSGWGAIVVVM
jgi:hypothetical protein